MGLLQAQGAGYLRDARRTQGGGGGHPDHRPAGAAGRDRRGGVYDQTHLRLFRQGNGKGTGGTGQRDLWYAVCGGYHVVCGSAQ